MKVSPELLSSGAVETTQTENLNLPKAFWKQTQPQGLSARTTATANTRADTTVGSVKYLENKELSERISKQLRSHRRSSTELGPARQALRRLGRAAIQSHLGFTSGRDGPQGARCHSRT